MSRVIITPLLLLYSPIGLVLTLLRSLLLIYVFLASVILYTVPPVKRIMLRSMCSILGFVVTSEGNLCCSREQPLVSNCATLFDHMALNLLTNCVTPYKFMLSWALTWRHLSYDESDYKTKIHDVFHLQPEETPTGTDQKIVLKFNPAPFQIFHKVQPVVISVSRYMPINLSVHPIDWKYEIFWLLFSPLVRVHVKFLPPITRAEIVNENNCSEENVDQFVEAVRTSIADSLGARLVDLDSIQFAQLSSGTHQSNINSNGGDSCNAKCDEEPSVKKERSSCNIKQEKCSNNDPRIGQIIAVLPNISPALVSKILEQISDVDAAIAHLLEHHSDSPNVVTSNQPCSSSSAQVTCANATGTHHVAPSCLKLAAPTFSRKPEERHRSFAERKAAFLENARQRYLELHQY